MTSFVTAIESPYELASTTDSQPVPCDYQGHDFWNRESHLCLSLHVIFVKYAATHRRISGYALRQAIKLFFDFAVEHNARNPEQLQLHKLTDITAETFNNFQTWLLNKSERNENAAKLKSAITLISKQTDTIPSISLPAIAAPVQKKTEPIIGQAFENLVGAFTAHVDAMYEKLEFRKKVMEAEPYTLKEVLEKYAAEYTRSNIFEWAQHRRDHKQKVTSLNLQYKLKHALDDELQALLDFPNYLERFNQIYNARPECYRFENPKDPFLLSLWYWDPDEARAIKTLLVNGYPMDVPFETLGTTNSSQPLISKKDCKTIVQLMLFRWNRLGDKKLIKFPVKPWDDFLGLYFPTMVDMSCIITFIMLQTNWNKETVLTVDENNFEHPLTGAISESQVIIQSEKNRSQGAGKPYYAPKAIVAVSSKADRYSSYNLIQLADKLAEPLKGYAFDVIPYGQENLTYNPLFLCLRYYGTWATRGGRHTSATNIGAFARGVKDFLRAYPVYENGNRLVSAKQITKRLRPTWMLIQRNKHGSGLGLLSMLMSHVGSIVTDVHYDSSGAAVQDRYNRLRSELEAIMDLLRRREYKGLLGKREERQVELPLKIFHIPGMEKPLWGCSNQLKPTWYGARTYVKQGERCYSIKNCLFCEQCNLYEDSLPYLIQRRIHVVELVEEQPDNESDYSSSLESELTILDSILDNWEDPDALKEAVRYQRRNDSLLPHDLDFLQIILEEEDMK
ncbi:hypothetical protein KJF94_18265 [Pseudomonas hormoni]|uniref:Integrase n=1 Tax=Pseudomonas hormoni TaxID=3093767 RepID=A0ABX8ESZ0_9PSED|nr:hypothetical protein [Pseudomonas hormoni]QVW21832.1 hypothetical protein KJF94_18265 [Pseudomonas hormoni]